MARRREADGTPDVSAWHFPALEAPDLTELLTGQHDALMLLDEQTIAQIFDESRRPSRSRRERRRRRRRS